MTLRNDDTTSRSVAKSRPSYPDGKPRVLIVDDDDLVRLATVRQLERAGYLVREACNGSDAMERLVDEAFDVVISEVSVPMGTVTTPAGKGGEAARSEVCMPGISGLELLKVVRTFDLDVPVILVTGVPDLQTAAHAVELGALRYLTKPVETTTFLDAVARAVKLRHMADLKREAAAALGSAVIPGERSALEVSFERALQSMWIAFQPIVAASARDIYGYEALMRTRDEALPNPFAMLDAAERLGRLHDLGRHVRALATKSFRAAPPTARLFMNLHTSDLLDDSLYSPNDPICALGSRVVLEMTERASVAHISDVRQRTTSLRANGYRIAVDDLGAGYAGLASFALLEPDFVKIDISLVRGVDTSPVKQRLIGTLVALCRDLRLEIVAEGIETAVERDFLVGLGCDLLQGYFFAKPGPL